MKYVLGLLGVLGACSCVWAAPEKMEMYATLSAPIASFWEVKTEWCAPVTMPNDSQLNLGFVAASGDTGAAASSGGTVTLQGNKPLQVENLYMEKNTSLTIGSSAKWLVDTLNVAPGGTVEIGGGLIVKKLDVSSQASLGTLTLTVQTTLRLGNTAIAPQGEFTNISSSDFNFSGTSGGSKTVQWGTVACSRNEPGCPSSYALVGG